MEKRGWFYVAFIGLGISVISLFMTIITYVSRDGHSFYFNIIDILGGSSTFDYYVLNQYKLIGVAVPSLVLILCVLVFGGYFDGKIGFGLAPVITPAAMIVCICAVIRRKNHVQEQLQRELEAKGKIWKPRDL